MLLGGGNRCWGGGLLKFGNESAEVDEEALLEGVFGGADGDDEMVTL